MYRLQYKSWGEWWTTCKYKTKRAAMVNLVKKKFGMPNLEWRVSTELDRNEKWTEALAAAIKKEDLNGNQIQ